MGRLKGCTKTGGRKKGTPNKANRDMKEWVLDVLNASKDAFVVNLSQAEPKDFCKVFLSLMGYVMPKMVAVSAEEMIKAEYSELEALFNRLPDEAIERISEKVLTMEAKHNGNGGN